MSDRLTDEKLIGKVQAELRTGAPCTADWPNLAIALAARLESVLAERDAEKARVAELEADRKRLALTAAHLRHAIPASEWGEMQCGVCGREAFLSSDGRYGDGDPALCGCGGCITVDEEARQVGHSDEEEEHSEDFAQVQQWAEQEVQEDPYRVSLAERAWQPIETAPKDGSNVLLALERGRHEARWNAGEPDEDGLWWLASGGVVWDAGVLGWMPLPAPPQAASDSERGGDA